MRMCRPRSAPWSRAARWPSDNRKQLEIGTMAPLDVVNADSTVATDKQALISSQSP